MNFFFNIKEIKSTFLKIENFYCILLTIIIFIFDRITKIKIMQDYNDNTFYVNQFINIDLTWNIGIGFGLLSTDTIAFYNLITVLIATIIIILLYFVIISKNFDKFIYSIIIGGAVGNFYDRLVYNAVPDFIDLHYNDFHWFTFNVADVFIVIGILIFLLRELLSNQNQDD